MVIKVLLLCGLLSSLFYIAADLMASWWYEGYNYFDQNYSELLATGAPTRFRVLPASVVYNVLLATFAVGVWISAGVIQGDLGLMARILQHAIEH